MMRCLNLVRGGRRPASIALAAAAVVALAGALGASAMVGVRSGSSTQRGSVLLSGSPSIPAVNLRTHTLYVPIQCPGRQSCPGKPTGHLLDIIDASRCNAHTVSGCRVVGKVEGGKGPLAAVLDPSTDTVYVIDGLGAVSVLDGGRCNATVRTHCRILATIRTGGFDVAGALDPRTHTLYVAAPSGDVFVIDVARCNAQTTHGCRQHVRAVKDPRGPDAIDVEQATDTVYVADGGMQNPGHTVTVINGARCNGTNGAGCGAKTRRIAVGNAPYWLTVDQKTDTVYTVNNDDGTVSIINGALCNGKVTSGCGRAARAVQTGGGASFAAVDQSRHTLFTLNQTDGTMAEINTRTCNGHKQSGCPVRARNERVPFNPPEGYNPGVFALVPGTGTAYAVNQGGEGFLAAISVNRCNALTTRGCRAEAPIVPSVDLTFPVLDPKTNTIYSGSHDSAWINVLNGATCNIRKLSRSGCVPVAKIPFGDPQANLGAIDRATHTLYASDTFGNTVWAIDIQHCNAQDTSGCSAAAPKMTIGIGPGVPVLDPATHSLYVPEGVKTSGGYNFNLVAVLNAATCNATVTTGCGQTPGTVTVGPNTYVIAMSTRTNTVYAASGGSNGLGRQLWVINGATCNATDHSGCSHPVTTKVGLGPSFVLVNDKTHTVYVSNNADGDHPGTVSVVDERACNGTHTTGCSRRWPAIGVGRSPLGEALDATANRIYVADFSAAAVSIIDGSRCDASHTGGCAKPASEQPVGSQPFVLLVNHRTKTVYATARVLFHGQPGDGMSVFQTAP